MRNPLCILLLLAACTQPPASVELKGTQSYSRNGVVNPSHNNVSYDSKTYNAAPTQGVVSTQSVGVSDLAPPPKSDASAPHSDNQVKAAAKKIDTAEASVNPWTGKSRNFAASTAPKTAPGLMWPVSSKKVISGFGPKGAGRANDGINIATPEGEPVWAAANGEIVFVDKDFQGYGNTIIIKHPGTRSTTYAHLSKISVEKYDRVKQGDIIGYTGSSGDVKKPQLHFAVHDGKTPVDPQKAVAKSLASL